jgi:hypothetical protein
VSTPIDMAAAEFKQWAQALAPTDPGFADAQAVQDAVRDLQFQEELALVPRHLTGDATTIRAYDEWRAERLLALLHADLLPWRVAALRIFVFPRHGGSPAVSAGLVASWWRKACPPG